MYQPTSVNVLHGQGFAERSARAAAFRRAMQQLGPATITAGECSRALHTAIDSGRVRVDCLNVDALYSAILASFILHGAYGD